VVPQLPELPYVRQILLALAMCASCAAQNGLNYSRIFPSLGNRFDTSITAMTSDAAGNVYLTGWTEDQILPVTPGVVQPNFGGGNCSNGPVGGGSPSQPVTFTCPDAFVVKLDANSRIVFATYLGSGTYHQATSIALDASGNIYVAGITGGFPTIPGSKFTGGATFIVKLNPSATTLLYTASIPGTGPLPFVTPNSPISPQGGLVMNMVVDSAGNAYFTASAGSGFPVTSSAIGTKGGIAVGKLDPTGQNLVYATYLGGSGNDSPGAIAIDAAGDAYLTGSTNSADFPTTKGVLQPALAPGSASAFVAKLNPSGNGLIYSTYLGGDPSAIGQLIQVDSNGNAYVLGTGDIPVTPGAYQSTNGAYSAFLAKLNPDATALVYATYISTNSVTPSILQVDAAGNAYVSGEAAQGFMASSDALQPCRAGGADAFVLQLAPDGAFAAATYLGGSGEDLGSALNVLSDGTVLLAGLTTTSDFLVTPDSPLSAPGYFIAKFQIANPGNASQLCSILAPENSANFEDAPIAPGELVTLWGLRFGPEAGMPMQFDSSGKVATELAGVKVFFNEFQAPILYAQSEQINAQVPWELAGQTSAQVHVEYNGVSTRSGIATLQASAPALFPAVYGSPQGAIINQDGTPNSPANPAPAGSVVSIYGTGGGATSPISVTGGLAPLKPLANLVLPAIVTIDGTLNADVQYAGVAPTLISGLFQINFKVPPSLGALATHRVDVTIGSGTTEGLISVTVATSEP
jgi:uncharacterized protein (TIGR03437 family)